MGSIKFSLSISLDPSSGLILCLTHHPDTPEQENVRMPSMDFNTIVFYKLSHLGLNISNTNTLSAGIVMLINRKQLTVDSENISQTSSLLSIQEMLHS